jgi:energy-coupling factor transport system ATP-binding protein
VRLRERASGGQRAGGNVSGSAGLVFQYPERQLFAASVRGEFVFSLRPLKVTRRDAEELGRRALAGVGLSADYMDRSPFGLSGGEKRRVALANVLATDPDWLLLDEPTAALDGKSVRELTDYLRARKGRKSGGVIVATHDLDAMLPVADRVIVLRAGRVLASLTPGELCRRPHLLRQAGVGLPSCLKLAESLAARGVPVDLISFSPAEMAAALAVRLRARPTADARPAESAAQAVLRPDAPGADRAETASTGGRIAASWMPAERDDTVVSAALPAETPGAMPAGTAPGTCGATMEKPEKAGKDQTAGPPRAGLIRRLNLRAIDPRAKWLVYIMLSAAILAQRDVAGIAASAAVTAAVVLSAAPDQEKLFRLTKPFLFFSLIAVLFSGLQFSTGSGPWYERMRFVAEPAAATLGGLLKIGLVMVLGLLLTLTTSQLEIKRALEQTLAALSRRKMPVEAFALGASLIMRFIPLIAKEVERLSLIARARGKTADRKGGLKARDMPAFAIPLLLGVLQHAEDLALAMELRGLRKAGLPPSGGPALRMGKRDLAAIAVGVVMACALLCVRLM